MKRVFGWVVVSLCLCLTATAFAFDFEVSPIGSNDCIGQPPCSLQQALTDAQNNGQDDTLTLEGGVYDGTGATFSYIAGEDKSLEIVGAGFIGDPAILDGNGAAHPLMGINTSALPADSFSNIRIENITFRNGASPLSGGGLFVSTKDANVRINRCNFENNKSTVIPSGFNLGGGGLFVFVNGAGDVFLTDSQFSHNVVTQAAAGGGLIASTFGDVVMAGNHFAKNTTIDITSPPNVQTFAGGAVAVAVFGNLLVNRNVFVENISQGGGGLVAVAVFGEGSITNNVVVGNKALNQQGPGTGLGGGGMVAVAASTGTLRLTNNTLVGNTAVDGDGGGLLLVASEDSAKAFATNNIIWGNSASGGILCTLPSTCNDIVVNDDDESPSPNNIGAKVVISHNDYSDIFFKCDPGAGCTADQTLDSNLDVDPLFVDAGLDNFHLSAGSPLIDKGIAVQGLPSTDFEGQLRNQGSAPDMGAFETKPAASPVPPPPPEDCANNVDDDGDLKIDCLDSDCTGDPACQGGGGGGTENCANNVDDDGDFQIDCLDSDCAGALSCNAAPVPNPGNGTENCANNADDDGDSSIDCKDSDCAGAAACLGGSSGNPAAENCVNNLDDDRDGKTDCGDSDCSGAAACLNAKPATGGGGGGGCSMSEGSPSSLGWLMGFLIPLLFAGLRNRSRLQVLKRSFGVLAIVMLFSTASGPASAAVFEVSDNGSNDCVNQPPCVFDIALGLSVNNGEDDTIVMRAGLYSHNVTPFTYTPLENKSLTIIGTNLAGQNTVVDGLGDHTGLEIDTSALPADSDADIRIEGVTFKNGVSLNAGAGLHVITKDADVTVSNCDFQFNTSSVTFTSPDIGGGGLSAFALNLGNVILQGSHFSKNAVTQAIGGGSAIGSTFGDVVMEGNTYVDNTTMLLGGSGTSVGGAAVIDTFGSSIINKNTLIGNSSQSIGGLFVVSVFGEASITNNIIANNLTFNQTPNILSGGAGLMVVSVSGSTINLTNNTITGNSSSGGDGGGLLATFQFDDGRMNMSNNIIWGNTASGGSACSTSCNDIFILDDFNGNQIGSIVNFSHNDFSDIAFACNSDLGCVPNRSDDGTGLNEDPQFVDAGQGDFRLATGSPLIDQGSALAPGLPAKDFAGNARIQGPNPDLGALESPFTPPPLTENCANAVDDDGDHDIDCLDSDCAGAAACLNPVAGAENCANDVDDDGDQLIDCLDPDCDGAAFCNPTPPPPPSGGGAENCANNVDDDGDGKIDCLDSNCVGAEVCKDVGGASENCVNGSDDDHDGQSDCGDSDCSAAPACLNPNASPSSAGGGCSMTEGSASPSFLLCLFLPLLVALSMRRKWTKTLRRTALRIFAAVALLSAFSPSAHSAVYDVSPGADADCSDFVCDLQSALTDAQGNDEDDTLNLAAGTYNGGNFTYLANAAENRSLTLAGPDLDFAVIDGGGNRSLSIDTSSATSDTSAKISISQIRFQNGEAATNAGGGLSVETNFADLEIRRCDFQKNAATDDQGGGGGGLAVSGNGSVSLIENNFRQNNSSSSGGGAVVQAFGEIHVEKNTFSENISSSGEVDNFVGGGGLLVLGGSLITLHQNTFKNNLCAGMGGGFIVLSELGSALVTDNIVTGNQAAGVNGNSQVGGGGGALISLLGSVTATQNTLTDNTALNGEGGGLMIFIASDSGETNLFNNIIFGNLAVGSTCVGGCNDIIVEDDFDKDHIGGKVNIFNNDYADLFLGCSLNQGCTPHQNVDGATNLHVDPLFVDAFLGADLRLSEGSPLIDKGSSSAPGLPAEDFEGNPRVQGPKPDMGAFEADFDPTENCANNVDDDGDQKIDCLDPDCAGVSACQGTGGGGTENCANNVDDDGDQKIDCLDPDCAGSLSCATQPPPGPGTEDCGNKADDDGDHLVDCADSDCSGALACLNSDGGSVTEDCANNKDDDGNGKVDCDDPVCDGAVACLVAPPPASSNNGGNCSMAASASFSFPFVFLGAPLLWALGRRRAKA